MGSDLGLLKIPCKTRSSDQFCIKVRGLDFVQHPSIKTEDVWGFRYKVQN